MKLKKGMSGGGGYGDFDFEDLVGLTFINVVESYSDDGDRLDFVTKDFTIRMFHQQDCCENVALEDVVGDLGDLLDTPIVMANETSNQSNEEYGSQTWTYYNIGTNKGSVNLRWLGESNGYYSEAVDLEII